jgi:hypothetical protein
MEQETSTSGEAHSPQPLAPAGSGVPPDPLAD